MTDNRATPLSPPGPGPTGIEWVAYGNDAGDLAAAHPEAVAEARLLLERLLDRRWAGDPAGLPKRATNGACRICCARGPLTFEHIPPQSTGNRERARGASAWDMLAAGAAAEFPERGWKDSQRGVGGCVLCASCNNRCGRELVPEYARFAADIAGRMARAPRRRPDGGLVAPSRLGMPVDGYALGLVARQAVAMLMASSGGTALARLHPELGRLVLTGGEHVPSGLRLGLALTGGSRIRLAPPHMLAGPDGVVVFQEVAATPFRWTLSWTGGHLTAPEDTLDVTEWLAFPADHKARVGLDLHIGMTIGPVPGDTRDLATIRQGGG